MKATIPVFLHASENLCRPEPNSPLYNFTAWSCNMSSCGYIPVGKTDLEFDLPSHEQIIARHAVLLRIKIAEVREEAEKKVADLNDQLSKLESLTYTPPAAKEPNDVP